METETETETPTRTDEKLAERRLAQLARHLPSSALGTLAGLKTATPEALERLNDALLNAFALLDAEGDAAHAGLVASAHADVEAEIARRPARPSLAAAGAHVPGNHTTRAVMAQRTPTGTRAQVLTASGSPVESAEDLAESLTNAVRAARNDRAGGTRHSFARARWSYPEDRQLDSRDAINNARRIEAVASPAAMVASGGICNPVNVDYSVPVISSDARPLKDGLPTFGATRGGVRFLQPPTLASVGAAGTTVWTAATDANPAGTTKPVYTMTCGQEVEVFVDAVPTRVRMGNLQAAFYPEMAAAITQVIGSAAARVAEQNILSKINASSTTVSSGQLLGAARDLLGTVDAVAAGLRYRQRLTRDHPLTVVFPQWAIDLLRSDLTRSMAHGDDDDNLVLTDAEVTQLLAVRGLSVVWTLDGQAAGTTSGIAFPAQGFGAQAAGVGVVDFPRMLTFNLFPAGSFQVLDGGVLDIAVVRDATLNGTNDFEVFHEVFEGVAYRGVEALQVVSTVRPNGLSAGTVSTSTY